MAIGKKKRAPKIRKKIRTAFGKASGVRGTLETQIKRNRRKKK